MVMSSSIWIFILILFGITIVNGSLNSGLLAYFPFEGNTNDESGNSLNGQIIGSPQYVQGVSGSAIQFNGISDCVHVPNPEAILEPPVLSVVVWMKFSGIESSGIALAIDTSHGVNFTGWVLQYFRDPLSYYLPQTLAFTRGNGITWNDCYNFNARYEGYPFYFDFDFLLTCLSCVKSSP